MKKLGLTLLILLQFLPHFASAQSMVSDRKNSSRIAISTTSFPDYYPFSEKVLKGNYATLQTVFDGGMELFAKQVNLELKPEPMDDYTEAVNNVRRGKIDILLGMYYGTKLYDGMEYVYPAILNNPIHVVMLPENIKKISTAEDLRNLKGAYIEIEHLSDYMLNNFKQQKILPEKNAYDAYEKLLTGEVDYVIGSYYYNYVEACRLGIKPYVSFSKNALWNMPMFIGISRASRYRDKLAASLKMFVTTEAFKQSIASSLKKALHQIELESQSIVPPKFVKTSSANDKTPADEAHAVDLNKTQKGI